MLQEAGKLRGLLTDKEHNYHNMMKEFPRARMAPLITVLLLQASSMRKNTDDKCGKEQTLNYCQKNKRSSTVVLGDLRGQLVTTPPRCRCRGRRQQAPQAQEQEEAALLSRQLFQHKSL